MGKRENVTVGRTWHGNYWVFDVKGDLVLDLLADQWRRLGLKPICKGETYVLDLQLSGVPKKRKVRK